MNTRKIYLVSILILIIAGYLVFSFSKYHTDRNRYNILPKGVLTTKDSTTFIDENNVLWILQPKEENIFHQPNSVPIKLVNKEYKLLKPSPIIDPDHPNVKLLSVKPSGASYEAILQSDNTYLNKGDKMGTYNYSNPSGFWSRIKHIFIDVLPHFINSNYQPTIK